VAIDYGVLVMSVPLLRAPRTVQSGSSNARLQRGAARRDG